VHEEPAQELHAAEDHRPRSIAAGAVPVRRVFITSYGLLVLAEPFGQIPR
jgi:hypothetical protein